MEKNTYIQYIVQKKKKKDLIQVNDTSIRIYRMNINKAIQNYNFPAQC